MPAFPAEQSYNEARDIIHALLPNQSDRAIVLKQLLNSIDLANAIAPDAWAVTLFQKGFRLNVGQVEAFVLLDGEIRWNFAGAAGTEPFIGTHFVTANYRSLSQPICAFVGNLQEFSGLPASLQPSHEQFIKLALTTKQGQPRQGTPFQRSHSSALIQYARLACIQSDDISRVLVQEPLFPLKELLGIDSPMAREGYELDRHILSMGRNARLAAERKVIDDHTCQACDFKLELDGNFIIEVHHITPLAATGETETSIEQLVSLCPTCHRIAHLRNHPFTVAEIRGILEVARNNA